MSVQVSIIVPIYKAEETLEKCINSLIKQSDITTEIILVDDGSPDGSGDICDSYKDSRNISVIHQSNAGVSVARNEGLKAAHGNYIMFVDPDDWLEPQSIKAMHKAAVDTNCDICYGCYIKEPHKKQRNYSGRVFELSIEDLTANSSPFALDINIISPWAKLYKRAFLIEHRIIFPEGVKRGQDGIFNYNALLFRPLVIGIDCLNYHYTSQTMKVLNEKYADWFMQDSIEFNERLANIYSGSTAKNKAWCQNFFRYFLWLRGMGVIRFLCMSNNFYQAINKMRDYINVLNETAALNKDVLKLFKYDRKKKVFMQCMKWRLYILLYFFVRIAQK